jgi:hypothetical protein
MHRSYLNLVYKNKSCLSFALKGLGVVRSNFTRLNFWTVFTRSKFANNAFDLVAKIWSQDQKSLIMIPSCAKK